MKKFTKIVATVADRRCDVDFLRSLEEAGMNVVRVNSAHMSEEGFAAIVRNTREASDALAVMLDTKGPEVRTTPNAEGAPIAFAEGDTTELAGDPDSPTTRTRICVNYAGLVADLEVGRHVMIDDGELDFTVEAIEGGVARLRANSDGVLDSRKGVNVPGAELHLPAVSDRDRHMIALAERLDVDFIAHSFVRSAADVAEVQTVDRKSVV